jgi:hypothetical protein
MSGFTTAHFRLRKFRRFTRGKNNGRVWFDGGLIRKDGIFLTKDLKALNPANLKQERAAFCAARLRFKPGLARLFEEREELLHRR